MKYIDINQRFTAKVAEYIAKGYTINTATMSGSQGEVAHVDLTDGKQVVRVLLAVYRVRQLCQSGRIKSIRCGRRILVNMDSLAAYLNEGDAVQPAPAVGGIRRADES